MTRNEVLEKAILAIMPELLETLDAPIDLARARSMIEAASGRLIAHIWLDRDVLRWSWLEKS